MKALYLIAVMSLAVVLATPASADGFSGRAKASDGDTFTFSVRLSGIDTPESRQQCKRADGSCYACGEESTEAAQQMIKDKIVTCEPTGDLTYGRIVAACFVDGKDYQEEIIRQGWAVVYRQYVRSEVRDAYIAAETEAKNAGLGIWQGEFTEPRKWRRGERLNPACD